ncbi:helix-turn-helix domain-containing protein [Leptospira kanakyensis]|uniref:Helix-turn-helix domain-containing protein n=1 Tax=Leptospira kanakyensis TaxID=2484968 RepID=A0A6N4QPI6_9LEPT|nr:helix-turn-helix domain-containing protein [Leptospira kanakyensis]TGK54896.1 helix-turn-helix domain-containing protein [Leptospira kanakyensis]TGK56384.1 helix-turn-helix domain-containing protein [Leptospira kanakyensis]TGK75820.1 helix-turn-helix domain-containing protein [Leptospira kanakyensis]
MKTNRTGIWIPVWIENLNLSHSQTKLYAEIVSLHDKGGCFASNRYFGEVLGLKNDTVSRLISSLKKLGLLEQTGFDGRRRFLKPIFLNPSVKSASSNTESLEKNPMQKLTKSMEITQVPIRQKSNAGWDKNDASFSSTIEVQKRVQKKSPWDEFKNWGSKNLSKSTYFQITNLSSPDSLHGSLNLIWKQWLETKSKLPLGRISVS